MKKINKSFDFDVDPSSNCPVLNIKDPAMLPFKIKAPDTKTYEVIRTKKGGLQMR